MIDLVIVGAMGVLGAIALTKICERVALALFPPGPPWWEDMDRLHLEYEDDVYGDASRDDPDSMNLGFDAWYREKYCTKKQPEQELEDRVYR